MTIIYYMEGFPMRRSKRLFVLAALVLALTGSVIFGTENYKDDFSGKIWGTWKAKGMIATGSKDKETGRTAPGALKITVGPDCPLNKSMCSKQHISILT